MIPCMILNKWPAPNYASDVHDIYVLGLTTRSGEMIQVGLASGLSVPAAHILKWLKDSRLMAGTSD